MQSYVTVFKTCCLTSKCIRHCGFSVGWPCRASARLVVSVWSGIAWGAVGFHVVFCLPPYSPPARSVLYCLHLHVRRALSTAICLLVRQLLGTMSLESMMEPGNGA